MTPLATQSPYPQLELGLDSRTAHTASSLVLHLDSCSCSSAALVEAFRCCIHSAAAGSNEFIRCNPLTSLALPLQDTAQSLYLLLSMAFSAPLPERENGGRDQCRRLDPKLSKFGQASRRGPSVRSPFPGSYCGKWLRSQAQPAASVSTACGAFIYSRIPLSRRGEFPSCPLTAPCASSSLSHLTVITLLVRDDVCAYFCCCLLHYPGR